MKRVLAVVLVLVLLGIGTGTVLAAGNGNGKHESDSWMEVPITPGIYHPAGSTDIAPTGEVGILANGDDPPGSGIYYRELAVPLYNQQIYTDVVMLSAKQTVAEKGCALCSTLAAFNYFGVTYDVRGFNADLEDNADPFNWCP